MKRLTLTLGVLILLAAESGLAHDLVRSHPSSGEILERPLRSVHLWFDDAPVPDFSVEIIGDGDTYGVTRLHTMGDNDLMAMVPDTLPDGDYRLRWTIGDETGEVPFSVQRPAGTVDDTWEPPLDIGIVLYDGAEPLDVFGPLEMWMNMGPDNVRVHLIAEEKRPIALTTTSYPQAIAPKLEAQFSFDDAPELDVMMVPGGIGTLVEVDNPAMIQFLQRAVEEVTVATSVCTGSALYAKAGLLDGVAATGNKAFFDYITRQGTADWQLEARWVEDGRFVTSSGVSAGIDMSLAVIERFFGLSVARMIAVSTEYEWNEDATRDPFVEYANSATPFVDMLRQRFEAE
ncbi:MAG: DJ-1/PfpI family protein [Pseudomonadota bacterium]